MFAHCSPTVPEVRAVNPDVPEVCSSIVRRAMAKEPMDRYPSAAAMLLDLQAALASTSPEQPPTDSPADPTISASPQTSPSRPSRRWIIAGGVAAVVLAVIAGL